MTYVVTEACIRGKYMNRVEVCPVDCFYAGENTLVTHPDECIDRGICEPECPAEAIVPDADSQAPAWTELDRAYAQQWRNFMRKKPPSAGADEWKGVAGKQAHFVPSRMGAS